MKLNKLIWLSIFTTGLIIGFPMISSVVQAVQDVFIIRQFLHSVLGIFFLLLLLFYCFAIVIQPNKEKSDNK